MIKNTRVYVSDGWHTVEQDGAFARWLERVNALLVRRLGLGVDDIPDQLLRDLYDNHVTPERALMRIIAELS